VLGACLRAGFFLDRSNDRIAGQMLLAIRAQSPCMSKLCDTVAVLRQCRERSRFVASLTRKRPAFLRQCARKNSNEVLLSQWDLVVEKNGAPKRAPLGVSSQ
jgi:hypothetical protein